MILKKKQLAIRVGQACTAIAIAAASQAALAQAAASAPQATQRVEVTGSRIAKQDFDSNSPITTVSAAELRSAGDVTLDTFLNTLPQVNPSGGTTSNNPPNGGQANIDLRGLGSNRNLVLIDGRRPMVSASDQTVDLNTIPAALIESIEVITGGAGAIYGADAVAGVVNIKLKKNFEGIAFDASTSNSSKFHDAREQTASLVVGGNFADKKGNAVMGFDYSNRQGMIKSQRDFSKNATSTTSFFPLGSYRPGAANAPSQAAVNALYGQASYGSVPAGTIPNTSNHSFNTDGTLFYPGVYNSPLNVTNYRYTGNAGGQNDKFFPDFYSYNFDAVNILTLPLERKSMMGKINYKLANQVEVFTNFAFTQYSSASALAPSPVPTVVIKPPSQAGANDAISSLVALGKNVNSSMIVPVTNPFIPNDLKLLLASRTGDNTSLVGSGATEPFLMRWRTLALGLRKSEFENTVQQYMVGARGPISFMGDSWRWEAYLSEGKTKITETQTGNVDTNRLQQVLEAPDGGASLCAGGVNPFGAQPLSVACQTFLAKKGQVTNTFDQNIAQGFISGDLAKLPAGPLSAVFGVEQRKFKYELDPGVATGPISGFNAQNPAAGKNSFDDIFGELSIPLVANKEFVKSLDLHLAYRHSSSESSDLVKNVTQPKQGNNTYSADVSWEPVDTLRLRGGLQRSVRAPNFGELFDGGGNNPSYFDPCSTTSTARTTGANAAQLAALCAASATTGPVAAGGIANFGLGAAAATYNQTPGTQLSLNTEGNTALKAEKGNSFTLGLVWQPETNGIFRGLRTSIDYYQIKVKDAINVTDPNIYVADCYNYYGTNAAYSADQKSCQLLDRDGGDLAGVYDPNTPSGNYAGNNNARIKTDGIDLAAAWGTPVGPGKLSLGVTMNILLHWKENDAAGLPTQDYAGTVNFFGPALGQSFPKIKGSLTGNYSFANFGFDARMRYIDSMKNRMTQLYPGERSFTGVPVVTYWDFALSYVYDKTVTFKVGTTNAFDKKPPTYSPNVQSGTDPSTYDVVGRRLFTQIGMKF